MRIAKREHQAVFPFYYCFGWNKKGKIEYLFLFFRFVLLIEAQFRGFDLFKRSKILKTT